MLRALREHLGKEFARDKRTNKLQLNIECLEDRLTPAIDFTVVNDWGSGLQGQITLTNDYGTTLENWRLDFDYDRDITSIWGASIESKETGEYRLAPEAWNTILNEGQVIQIGFTAGTGTQQSPENFEIHNGHNNNSGQSFGIDFFVSNQWANGFSANIAITNKGDEAINGWTLKFEMPHRISDLWNGKLQSQSGDLIFVQNESWNAVIMPGATVSFGFNASRHDNITQPRNYVLNGTPLDGDDLPAVTITDATIAEGDTGETIVKLQVSLSQSSSQSVSMDYATSDGTANAAIDYVTKTGSLVFAPGETSKEIALSILGDTDVEENEDFSIVLSNIVNATVSKSTGTITITNDDAPPTVRPSISVSDVAILEGNGESSNISYFSTSGNQIVDASGSSVKIAGVNWFGFESSTFAPHGLWTRNYQEMMDEMVALGFNSIRLPFSNEMFDSGSIANGIDFVQNPDLQGLKPIEIMDRIVEYAGEIGIRILLDHHRSNAGAGAEGSGLWYTSAYPEDRWIADWVMLAERYQNNPVVIGADLHNEPHGPATWGTGGTNDWRLAAERAGNAILNANPNWLIVVEGVESGVSGNYWWGGNLSNARNFPVRLDISNQLVYSAHDYPASIYPQNWFNDSNYPDNLPEIWDQNWGYLFRENIAPVLLGEFGSKLNTTSDQLWYEKITSYLAGDLDGNGTNDLDTGELGISWTYWSWNPNSGDTGGILKDDWRGVNENKVDPLEPIQFEFPGGGGQSNRQAQFTVSLSEATTETVTVNFRTSGISATPDIDFVAKTGMITFAPGETQKTVMITIIGDTMPEEDETFEIILANSIGGDIGDGIGRGTILNDDSEDPAPTMPRVSITDASKTEGDSGTSTLEFTVSLSAASSDTITVDFSTGSDTANAGEDYVSTTGTLSFAPGETSKSITVIINGDTDFEESERFHVNLSNPVNANLERSTAAGTIINDDASSSPRVEFIVQDNWGSGFRADMVIHNDGDRSISNWVLEFDAEFDISNIWNAKIVSHSNGHYTLQGLDWNANIAAGSTLTLGFTASPGGTINTPTNYELHGGSGDNSGNSGNGSNSGSEGKILIDGIDDNGLVSQLTVAAGISTFTLDNSGMANPDFQILTNNNSILNASIDGLSLTVDAFQSGRASLRIEETTTGAVRYVGIRITTETGAIPGLPNYVAIGSVSEDSAADLNFWRDFDTDLTNKRMDVRYIYLNGGPEYGWRTWSDQDGGRLISYLEESQKLGILPYFVWYNIPDGGESYYTNLQHIQSQTYMESYYEDLRFALDLIQQYSPDDPVGFVLEPDFLGYLMQQSGKRPDGIAAVVSAAYTSGVLNVDEDPVFENTVSGLVQSINYTIQKYAPNVEFGWQFNLWASPGVTVNIPSTGLMHLTDTMGIEAGRAAIVAETEQIANYYIDAGVLSYGADFIAIDKYGLDAAAQPGAAANPADSTWFWNADHWNNYLLFSKTLHTKTNKPVILWQIPVGHINSSQTLNPYDNNSLFPDLGNTFTKYEDSAPTFFLGDTFVTSGDRFDYFSTNEGLDPKIMATANAITWESHMEEAADAGIVAILFGAGVGESTDGVGSDPTDDYWWITKVQEYYLDPFELDD